MKSSVTEQIFQVERYITHEKYNSRTLDNDIGKPFFLPPSLPPSLPVVNCSCPGPGRVAESPPATLLLRRGRAGPTLDPLNFGPKGGGALGNGQSTPEVKLALSSAGNGGREKVRIEGDRCKWASAQTPFAASALLWARRRRGHVGTRLPGTEAKRGTQNKRAGSFGAQLRAWTRAHPGVGVQPCPQRAKGRRRDGAALVPACRWRRGRPASRTRN